MKKTIWAGVALVVLALFSGLGYAGPIRSFEFTGVVTYGYPGYPSTGTLLHGSFSYDQSAQLAEPWGAPHYINPITAFTLDGLATMLPGGGQTIAINYHVQPPGWPLDQFVLIVDVAVPSNPGIYSNQFTMRLRDEKTNPTALTSFALPDTLDFSQFTNSYFSMGGLYGTITSLNSVPEVPEPETFLLFLAALAAVGITRRRHLALPFTHNYFHPELAEASANPAHIICKQA